MKKIILLFSLIVPLFFNSTSIIGSEGMEFEQEDSMCDNPQNSTVRIINNYDFLKSNGIVYKVDNLYSYIITTSDIINKNNNFKVIYNNGKIKEAKVLGYDKNNQVSVLKAEKEKDVNPVCFANSDYIYKGQLNYVYGYSNTSTQLYLKTALSQVGALYSNSKYMNIYKSIVDIQGSEKLKGVGVFDELNRLIGMITGFDSDLVGGSYITESNRLLKIADSIVKTGKYNVNYIKYSLVDYSGLGPAMKKNYDVSSKANSGVVIATFKPFNYLFGGLNQGMVIVAVNGIEIKNMYELDKQLARYEKNDNVCLKVIKKNGKIAFYHVKV